MWKRSMSEAGKSSFNNGRRNTADSDDGSRSQNLNHSAKEGFTFSNLFYDWRTILVYVARRMRMEWKNIPKGRKAVTSGKLPPHYSRRTLGNIARQTQRRQK